MSSSLVNLRTVEKEVKLRKDTIIKFNDDNENDDDDEDDPEFHFEHHTFYQALY